MFAKRTNLGETIIHLKNHTFCLEIVLIKLGQCHLSVVESRMIHCAFNAVDTLVSWNCFIFCCCCCCKFLFKLICSSFGITQFDDFKLCKATFHDMATTWLLSRVVIYWDLNICLSYYVCGSPNVIKLDISDWYNKRETNQYSDIYQ